MSSKWQWVGFYATLSAFLLGVLVFLLTYSFTLREVIVLIAGAVIGATGAAFIAVLVAHKRHKSDPAVTSTSSPAPMPQGQFTDQKRANELKRDIDNWESQRFRAQNDMDRFEMKMRNAGGDIGTNAAKLKLGRAVRRDDLLGQKIAEARKERETLRTPVPRPIRIAVPKGRIPTRDSTTR
jgi:hypothetical protein